MFSCAVVARPALFSVLALAAAPASAQQVVHLQSLDLAAFEQDWGQARADRSVDDHALSIGGVAFARGVGTHANSEVDIALGGDALGFSASVGVDDEIGKSPGSVVFVVRVDGVEKLRTKVLRAGDAAVPVQVDLTGARTLTLQVEDADDSINYDHADWAMAEITVKPGKAGSVRAAREDEQPLPIASIRDDRPHINHPRITGASPRKPFLFRIPASGKAPLHFVATGLPDGITLDADRGVLAGALPGEGRWQVEVTVGNALGKDTRKLTLVGAPNALLLTPPLGWNSWNCWALAVDDGKVRAAADAFVQSGLAAHGYSYVNIDDGWEKGRAADGRIETNERFPDMRALAGYVHQQGLKIGIYSSPGPTTCGGYTGSYQHELQDAQSYAAWGIDYLKYDWCSYGQIAPRPDRAALMKPYEIMRDALRGSSRDIAYSLCQYGMGKVWEWGHEVDGNCWRTTGDITDSWSSMAGIGFAQSDMSKHAGPGRWNDPDMLVVGRVGWGPNLHPTKLTHNEQITHMTLWSMLAAPLLIGCDLEHLDDFTLDLLTNDDVLAISQDPLGRAAERIRTSGSTEVWTRPLADGTTAVALFNRSRQPTMVDVSWKEIGRQGPQPLRDCWQRRDLGVVDDTYVAQLPRHGALLLRVGRILD